MASGVYPHGDGGPKPSPPPAGKDSGPPMTARAGPSSAARWRPLLSELEDIDRGGHSSAQAAEEHAPGRRMLQQRQDQSAMLIEPRGLTDDRHDAIRAGELEERFDVHV